MAERPQEFRSRLEFSSTEEWVRYVQNDVPSQDRAYVTEFGFTVLYLRFYEIRGLPVPRDVRELIEQTHALPNPARVTQLKSVNARLFNGMNQALLASLPLAARLATDSHSGVTVPFLVDCLERENESYALWCDYKRVRAKSSGLPSWEQYVHALLDDEAHADIEFALAMGTLGELLRQLQAQRQTVPSPLAKRIRVLHRERKGRERDLATRILLQELLEVLTPCSSV